ncbi:MAG: PAS domain S-box protein [Alphaproteobacteria bacterium]|nr:PAS domain S-box protein [Alphaproteobacteria bacterium]
MNEDISQQTALPAIPGVWELFLAHTPAAVAVLDRRMRYLAVSDRWRRDLELQGRPVVGESHYDVFEALDDVRRERHRRCLAGETLRLDSDEYVLPSGTRLSVRWEYVPWRDAAGEVGGMLIFAEVVTRERMLEEQVAAEAGRLKRAELVGRTGAWEWDLKANRVTWSEGVRALLGLDATEDSTSSWLAMIHPLDRAELQASLKRALRGEIPYDLETRVVRDDGRVMHIRFLGEVTRDGQGNPVSVIGAVQDVSELRRKELELSAVHRRYRLASEVSGTAAWEIWPVERRIFGDENLARLVGRGNEQLSDDLDEWIAAFPPDDRRKLNRTLEQIVSRASAVYDLTIRTRLPDGRTIWLTAYGRVIGGTGGERMRIVGTTQDVTERKLAELALENSERNLQVAQRLARVGSWEWEVGLQTLSCSPEMLRLYGFEPDRKHLRLSELIERVHPDDRARVAEEVESLRLGLSPSSDMEMRLSRPGHDTIWIRAHARGVSNEAGKLVRLHGAVQDITESKRADRDRMIRDSALQASMGAVGMCDMDGMFFFGNRSFMELLGIDDQEALRKVQALEVVRDPQAAQEAFGTLLGEQGHWEGELPIRRMNGEHRDVLVTATVHRGGGSDEPFIIASYMDVTDRNEALRELARRERQLSQAQAMARMGETHYDLAARRYSLPANTRLVLGLGEEFATFTAEEGRRLIHPDDWERIDKGARRLIAGALPYQQTTYRFLSPSRGTIHVQTVHYPEHDEQGRVVGLNGVIQDVTHIKRAEQEAREARERAERYLDISGAIIIALDADGRITLVNRQGRVLLGYEESELLGEDWFDVAVPEDVRAELRGGAAQLMDHGPDGYNRREGYVVTRSGERRLIEWLTSVLRDDSGVAVGILSSGRDLTDLRQAERSLRESEMRTRAVMEAASVGIAVVERGGLLTSLNPQAERILGGSRETLGHRALADFLPPEQRSDFAALFRLAGTEPAGRSGGPLREFAVVRGEGDRVPVEISVTPMEAGGETAFVAAIQDITERKRAEAQMQQVQRLETIGQLTGGVAHDFNNLLMAMQVNVEMLKEIVGDDLEGNDYADAALNSVARGAELTRRLLAFSRRQPLRPKVIDVNRLIAETVRILERTLGEPVAIETDLHPQIWPVEVDRAQLENVLMNLALNARDAMPLGGRLTIETANTQLDEEYTAIQDDLRAGDFVMVAVSDTGSGMTPEVASRAFEPFFTTKDVGRGSGLGLSMTYGFVKQSGGHIRIYSEPGRGTTIKIYFPRVFSAVEPDEARRQAVAPRTGTETILLVEDDAGVRDTVTVLLRSLGYHVLVAADGPEAIALVAGGARPDLLLADIVLPEGMTGREVAEEVGRRVSGCRTLYMSGYTENAVIHDGRLDEGVVLLSKPFPKAQLAEKLREVLDA